MTRDEHLAWAKKRALEYVDRCDLLGAVASMGSDLAKHEDFQKPAYATLFVMGAMFEVPKGPDAVRRWVKGFN